jgi:hypothetical protein
VDLPPQLQDPAAAITPEVILDVLRAVARHYFPGLAETGPR